ncbi:MAG: ABC transporter permease [Gaiellaceae bacterium MAG52_C11]|nr:ABC transporter permease [Candidatus Gaiellasilicea maunaloa]
MRVLLHQLRSEQLIFWRNRESAGFIFVFPLMLFLLLGAFYGDETTDEGYAGIEVLLAGMLGYGAANTGFAGMAITLVVRREYGILKRIRSTPLPASSYFAAALASTLFVFALQALVLLGLGRVLYDTALPERPLSLAFLVAFGAAAFAGMGIGTASLIRSAEGSSAVVNFILLPMAFLSGSFGGRDYPRVIEAIASVLPLKYFVDLLRGVYLEHERAWSNPGALAVVAAWGLGGALLGVRRFGWEPRER